MNAENQDRKAVIISRKTRYDELIERFGNNMQAEFYLKNLGQDISDYKNEDILYKTSVSDIIRKTGEFCRVQHLLRDYVPNFIFGKDDIVVVIGPDGLVANTLKYLDGQPLAGVNPYPGGYDGVLLPFGSADVCLILRDIISGVKVKIQEISMALAQMSDGQQMFAVNDIFIGRKTHVSARYTIAAGGKSEEQSSSGVIISTGLGSTGWLKSIIAGARGISQTGNARVSIERDSRFLYYSVREPFQSGTTGADIVFGKIEHTPLRVISHMPEGGVVFSDGVEEDFLRFDSGIEVTVGVADKRGYLVVN